MPGNKKKQKKQKTKKTITIKIKIKTITLTKILYKAAIFNLQKVTSNLFVTKRKSMVAFNLRCCFVSSKLILPLLYYNIVKLSIICQ